MEDGEEDKNNCDIDDNLAGGEHEQGGRASARGEREEEGAACRGEEAAREEGSGEEVRRKDKYKNKITKKNTKTNTRKNTKTKS